MSGVPLPRRVADAWAGAAIIAPEVKRARSEGSGSGSGLEKVHSGAAASVVSVWHGRALRRQFPSEAAGLQQHSPAPCGSGRQAQLWASGCVEHWAGEMGTCGRAAASNGASAYTSTASSATQPGCRRQRPISEVR